MDVLPQRGKSNSFHRLFRNRASDLGIAMNTIDPFLAELNICVEGHQLWRNPLLKRMEGAQLSSAEWSFIAGHHYQYSRQFTRFLGALLGKLYDPKLRGVVVRNLIEEEGEGEESQIHSNILKQSLVDRFGPSVLPPPFAEVSDKLAHRLLGLIDGSEPFVAAAVLAFGCEAIVHRLYRHFVQGMEQAGFTASELYFFKLHIDCDEGHAAELLQVLAALPRSPQLELNAKAAVLRALDERDAYYAELLLLLEDSHPISSLCRLIERPAHEVKGASTDCKTSLSSNHPTLYSNEATASGIGFHVSRFHVPATVLDPRLLTVEPRRQTERHAHAHESFFLVLSGQGLVRIGEETVPIRSSDIVFVPRWVPHQTVNTENLPLQILAVTDFNLTCRFGNTDESYRLRS